ncbi:MAG: UvrD-helicase domain-containing protein, partial [Phycisphaerae bacterium]|nr:UvrD-helicase domain-containing protein [Phycisphaerae bacterium]
TRRFSDAKKRDRVLDFADLERRTLNILDDHGSPSFVARKYRKRFAHVLVDEYQDINEVQDRILFLISREPRNDDHQLGGNLFCVGDVKQSIYRFRLAQPENFLDRERRFGRGKIQGGGEVIDLRTNFRSRSSLLGCLNELFERLMIGKSMEITYDDTHRLNPPEQSMYDCHPCGDAPVDLHLLPDEESEETRAEREAAFVAREIRRLVSAPTTIVDRNNGEVRSLAFGDIAILLRTLKGKADIFAQALRSAGVPVRSESNSGFFESHEIRDMLALLAVLDNARQDIPLAAVLRSPLIRLLHPEDEMAAARIAYPAHDIPFHLAIERFANENAGRLRDAMNTLARWREWMNRRPLDQALQQILMESGYLAYCAGLDDGEQRVANLDGFIDRAQQFCATPHRQGLARFRAFLETLREEDDLAQPSVGMTGTDAVRIMTIHRAKGLEFSVVIVPDLGKKHTMKSAEGSILVDRQGFVGLEVVDPVLRVRYPSLPWWMARSQIRQHVLAEELRVLYVAATRACERLILVGTCSKKNRETWERFADHREPLTIGTMLSSTMPLDWIASAAYGIAASSPKAITIYAHNSGTEPVTVASSKQTTPLQDHLIARHPITKRLPPNNAAETLISRLEWKYPYEGFCTSPAVMSVTQLAALHHQATPVIKLDKIALPRRDAAEPTLSAAEIGDATHLVLERANFAKPLDAQLLAVHV